MPVSSHSPSERWISLIEEFQSFGGTANNVVQREGDLGLGLFPIDPSKPVELRAPKHLLVRTDNLILENGEIAIKDDSTFPKGYSDWYARFQADFSWGAEAQQSIRNFEEGLRLLPEECLQLLSKFGFYVSADRYPADQKEEAIFQRFLKTRQINWKGETYLMPIIELINHSPKHQSWGIGDNDINVKGLFKNEMLVRYSIADPLIRLIQYGFNCREPMCFSINQKLTHKGKTILVKGGINYEIQKPFQIDTSGDKLILNNPLLSHSIRPKLPRQMFKESVRDHEWIDADELFELIHLRNNIALIKILKSVEGETGMVAKQLTDACLDQFEILRHRF